jgi:rhodanese-related sulfurtransferase
MLQLKASKMRTRLAITHDLLRVSLLAIVSLLIGLGSNLIRKTPVSLTYQSPEQRFSAQLSQIVAAPPMPITNSNAINFDQFRGVFDSKSAVILDARDKAFYDRGHIPGALSLPRDTFATSYEGLRSTLNRHRTEPIVVYCSGGDCHDSRLVAGALLSLGYLQVKVFVDGWTGWTDNHMPIAQ